MTDIFISYSRRDADFVRRLHASLEERGRDAWVDWEDIPPAWDWKEELQAGIDRAGVLLFVITPDSLRSEVCGQELEQAVAHGKRIVPVVRREPGDAPVPAALADRNWIFLRDDAELEPGLERLISALDTDAGWVRDHTRLLVRAVEWDRTERRESSLLLRGADLSSAEQALASWRSGTEPEPTALQHEYVAAGRRAAARRTRTLLGAAGVALAVSIVLGVLALIQRDRAVDRERTAQSRALAVQSLQRGETDPELSVLLSLEAVATNRTPEGEEALRLALSRLQARGTLRPSGKPVTRVGIASRDRVVAAAGDGTVRLWDPLHRRERELRAAGGTLSGVAISSDGRRALVADSEGGRVHDVRTRKDVTFRAKDLLGASLTFDGRSVLGLMGSETVRRWDARTGRPVGQDIREPGKEVVTVSPDRTGRRVLVGFKGGEVALYDTVAGRRLHDWYIPASTAFALSLSLDGDFAAGVSTDVRLGLRWDAGSGRAVPLTGHTLPPQAVNISRDGGRVATGGLDNKIRLWSGRTGKPLRVLRGHTDAVTQLRFSPDRSRLFSISLDETARVWNVETGEQLAVLRGHRGDILWADLTDDGRYVVTGGQDGTARLWEASPGRTLAAPRHRKPIEAAALDPAGRFVASSSADQLKYVDASTGREIEQYDPSSFTKGATGDLAFDPRGRYLAVGDGNAAFVVDVKSDDYDWLNHGGLITSVAWTRDGARLITASEDGTARVIDPAKPDRAERTIRTGGPLVQALPTPDGRRVVTLDENGTARLYATADGKMLEQSTGGGARAMAMSGDGARVAIAGEDGIARVWRADGRSDKPLALRHKGIVNAVRFSRDGRLVATGSADGTARVWDARTGRELHTLRRHLDPVRDVDFSPDGRFLMSASDDRQALVWDLTTGRVISVFGGHDGPVLKARFSSDGTKVLTVPEKGAAAVYACDACGSLEDVVARARELVGRKLTDAERDRYLAG